MVSHQNNNHKSTVLLMAIAGGVFIANIYYNQPILKEIGASIHANETSVGVISILTQLGFGLGIFFLMPLGDKLDRKKLILALSILLVLSLLGFTLATTVWQVYVLSFVVGLCATPAQIILPMAATIDHANRGKIVGTVFSGVLVGILGARVLSGAIAEWLGWRYVYGISAIMVFIITILLKMRLPAKTANFNGNYLKLLWSTFSLIREFSVLRQAALLGSFTFGIFCSFWTTLTFHLGDPPLNYPPWIIGSFGLIAIGGALITPYFGKLADKGNTYRSLLITVNLIIGSIILLKIFPYSLIALITAVFFLDIGVQATQVTNFTRIYSLPENAHSRINTIYMTTYFIGAAIGTYIGVLSWNFGGWNLSTWQMLLWGAIAITIVIVSEKQNTWNTKYKRSL